LYSGLLVAIDIWRGVGFLPWISVQRLLVVMSFRREGCFLFRISVQRATLCLIIHWSVYFTFGFLCWYCRIRIIRLSTFYTTISYKLGTLCSFNTTILIVCSFSFQLLGV
jgi:hypothetical protein